MKRHRRRIWPGRPGPGEPHRAVTAAAWRANSLLMTNTQTAWARASFLALAIPVLLAAADTPKAAVDELLAADRAFSAASAKTDVVAGLSAMFADDVVMPVPSGRFAEGKSAAKAALASNADNTGSRI